ncbi:hypothetical protein GYMLUDRAFT_239693 [Collybiopsis luxurians FD-317 M1]|nr:hypothetical protein GYMLUDRAFT_239693 [Collybiopsis luxurians FD-317 M1]
MPLASPMYKWKAQIDFSFQVGFPNSMYTLLVSSCFSYLIALATYRLFFHPLHKYPGSIFAALTDWYEAYHNIVKCGGLVAEIDRLHKIHGPVIRIGPNKLHFNDRRAYHDIYTYGSTLFKDRNYYHGILAHCPEGTITTCDPQEAKRRRGLLGPLFSRQALLELEYTIQKKVDQLVNLLEECYSSPDSSTMLSSAYRSLTTDVITEYCFADSTNTLADPKFAHPVVQSVRDLIDRVWIQRHFPFIVKIITKLPPAFILWLLPPFQSYLDMKEKYERQIDNFIRNPDAFSNTDHETIYHHLLQPKDPGLRLSKHVLVQEAFNLVPAGSDTVGHTCTVGTYFALKDRSILQKLTKELREVWPDMGRPMSFVALEKLPYLTAFIKESLRVGLGLVHPLPRIVNQETTEIGGLKIPAGTVVAMSHYFMHTNADIFPDPHVFNPDRWLAGETKDMTLDLVSFSKGHRICLGINLAWTELYLIFGNIFRKLDLQLVDTTEQSDLNLESMSDFIAPQWKQLDYKVFVKRVHE